MSMQPTLRLGPAELTLIEQLTSAGAAADAERLATVGLPTRKVESYHYTDLKQLWRDVPPVAPASAATALTANIDGAYTIAIANGVVQLTGAPPEGVFVGTTDTSPISRREDILTHLNLALAKSALRVQIDRPPGRPIHIDRRIDGAASHSASAAGIHVGDGVEVTIVETYGGSAAAHVANHGTFLSVGRNAKVTHIVVDLNGPSARTFAVHEYDMLGDSKLRTLTVQAGSALSRTLVEASLRESGAHADLTGLNLTADEQHHDITLQLTHAVPRTSSKPLYKQIGRGRSRAVFQGRILVARDAQKTDAKMMMQGLMLSPDAEIFSKPELEIYADDVVCGHGSTCGDLDDTALFYLMSRGIPKTNAESILIRAFLAELVDAVSEESVRDVLGGIIEGWLAGTKGQA